MKNKETKGSIFKKKGFYVALYSSLGVVMVAAAVVSFRNLSSLNNTPAPLGNEVSIDFSQMEAASANGSDSYLSSNNDALISGDDDMLDARLKSNKDKTEQNQTTPTPTSAPTAKATPKPGAEPQITPTRTPEPTIQPQTQPQNQPQTQPQANADDDAEIGEAVSTESTEQMTQQESQDRREAETVFNAYSEDAKMLWPVIGDVVMTFSDAHLIYDQTLDQYRTNDNICIAADAGAQVCSAADGVVEKITSSREDGNTVVINHGGGWSTTYSQLQDSILVREGEVVKAGQAIGGVANPSIYSVLLGSHVQFKVSREDSLVNPLTVLEQ